MTTTKTCKECGKRLRASNKSGYCRKHMHLSLHGPAHVCETCGDRVPTALWGLHRANHARAERPACAQCGGEIHGKSWMGLCNACRIERRDGAFRLTATRPEQGAPRRLASILVRIAAQHTGLSVAQIKGRSKAAALVRARHAVTLVAWETGGTCGAIAKSLGRKDHSTIVNGRYRAQLLMGQDPQFAALVEHLRTAPILPPPVLTPVRKQAVFRHEWDLSDDEVVSLRASTYLLRSAA